MRSRGAGKHGPGGRETPSRGSIVDRVRLDRAVLDESRGADCIRAECVKKGGSR